MRAMTFILLLSLPGVSSLASAETLRCGSYLIREGDDVFSVLSKCGEPTDKSTITEPVYASGPSGNTFPTGAVAETQVWRYNRGSGQFPVIIKISDGVVRSIHFVR